MQVLVFQHAPLEGIGSIAVALRRRGIDWRTVEPPSGPVDLGAAAGLILMGGPMSVNDDLPWIPHETAAIREAADRGIPVLGICLGAQLIARALGARVYRNPVKEIGWFPLEWTAAAHTDPLFQGFRDPENVFQWHGETFDLPRGAARLASSLACPNQAFRAGANVYGMQFHLEVTPEIIADWLRQDAACGAPEAGGPIDACAHSTRLGEMAAIVFDRWSGLLH